MRPIQLLTISGGLLVAQGAVFANQILNPPTAFGIDDYNHIDAMAPAATDGGFVMTAIKNSGFKTPGWVWHVASKADSDKVRADMTVDPYTAWVVNDPGFKFPDGTTDPADGPDDWGGVIVLFKFAPKAGDPLSAIVQAAAKDNTGATQLHWLQVKHKVDNLGLDETTIDNSDPWYDVGGAAGLGGDNGVWLGDAPNAPENGRDVPDPDAGFPGVEPADPYVYTKTFETYLAVETKTDGVNKVDLYGGMSWGFTYTAADTPEPSSA